MHIVEKGANYDFGHCPDPNYTYELTKACFPGKEVWVIPEYEGNLNFAERLEWLRNNFANIFVVIDVFEGGSDRLPNPNVMLSLEELEQIMEVTNVMGIRFPEVTSWKMNATAPDIVSTAWIHSMFDFAISRNLTIFWSEWKLGSDVDALTKPILAGYEDKIIYLCQTNNQFQHPLIGYSLAEGSPRWGASVQSWWTDEQNGRHDDLPLEYVAQYARLARNMGAEIIQLEPYWYFFDNNGEPLATLHAISSIIQ